MIDTIIGFILGGFVGSFFTIVIMAILIVGGRHDKD